MPILTIIFSPDVEFCAYAIPHPSEAKMNIRIQTYGKKQQKCQLNHRLTPLQKAPRRSMHFKKAYRICRSSVMWLQRSSGYQGTSSWAKARHNRRTRREKVRAFAPEFWSRKGTAIVGLLWRYGLLFTYGHESAQASQSVASL